MKETPRNPRTSRCPRPTPPRPRPEPKPEPCPQLPGTIIRIFIPKGAEINLLNLIEITSPSGICLIVRSPILDKDKKKDRY